MKTMAIASAILLSAASLHGAEIFKANNTDDLNLDSSWEGGVVPGADDVAIWPLAATQNLTTGMGAPWTVGGIVVTNGTGETGYNSYNVTINGSDTLTLGQWGIDYNGKKTLTVNPPISVDADQMWRCQGGGTLVVANSVTLNGHVIAFAGNNTKQAKGLFSGSGTLLTEANTLKMSNGSAAPDADARITLNSTVSFDTIPAVNGNYRFRNVTLDGTGNGDGATLHGKGRSNENGHDKISGTVFVGPCNGTITLEPDTSKHLSFEASGLSVDGAGFVHFKGTNLGLATLADLEPKCSTVLFGTAPALLGGAGVKGSVSQSILPAAVVSTNTADMGFTFATYDSDYGIRPLDLDTEYATALPLGQNTLENVRLVNDGTAGTPLQTLLPDGLTVVNSLIVDVGGANGGGGCVLDAQEGASPTLRVASGMIYVRNMKAEPRTDGDQIPFQNFTLDLNGQRGVFITRQSDQNNMTSKALELRCPIVNDGGNGINFCCIQGRGFAYLYGTAANTYTGPTRLVNGYLKLMKANSVQNVCIPGDLEIYAGTCQNTGDTIPDTSDIRIYGGSLIQRGGASNSGSGSSETFRDLTIFRGSCSLGSSGTSSGGTTMRNATLFAGTMTQTRGHRLTMTGTLALAGGAFAVNRYEKLSNRTLQFLQGGISITNTPAVAYTPMAFDAGTSGDAPGAKSTLSVGVTFTGNTTNDNTAVIAAAAPGEGIEWAQFLMDGDLVFDIGDGAADVDLRIEPQLVDNGTTVGALAKRGTGTLALMNPTNTYTGGTSVEAGRLIADGALAGDVTVASGATFRGGDMGETGALSVGGDVTFAAGAKLEVDPGAATTVAGDVSFAGTEIVLKSGAEITEDVLVMKAQSFSGGVSGTFGRYAARYRAGGTELWIAKDKVFSIIIR